MPCQHLAAKGAVVQHEAHELRVGKRIVLGDRDDRADIFLLEGITPEPRDPLHAVGIEAEKVVRRRTQGGVLRCRRAVDERHLGHALGEFADCDALDPRKGTDEDAGTAVDQHARLRDHRVRGPVSRFDECFDGSLAGASLVLAQGQLVTAHGVLSKGPERAFERGEHADLQAVRVGLRRNDDHRQRGDDNRPRHEAMGACRKNAGSSATPVPRRWRRLRHAMSIMLSCK